MLPRWKDSLTHTVSFPFLRMSQFPKEDCTACARRQKRPYNTRCRYLKAALAKCMELRAPTADYRLHLPDINPEWERPDTGDDEVDDGISEEKVDIGYLVQENIHYKKELADTKGEVSKLCDKIVELTLAVNTMHIDQAAGVGSARDQVITTVLPAPTTTTVPSTVTAGMNIHRLGVASTTTTPVYNWPMSSARAGLPGLQSTGSSFPIPSAGILGSTLSGQYVNSSLSGFGYQQQPPT